MSLLINPFGSVVVCPPENKSIESTTEDVMSRLVSGGHGPLWTQVLKAGCGTLCGCVLWSCGFVPEAPGVSLLS